MPLWKRLVLISLSASAGLALVACLVIGAGIWYNSRPKPWQSETVTGTFSTVEFQANPDQNDYKVGYIYDLQNNGATNYTINPADVVIMAKLTEGDVLSKEFGHYQTSDVSITGPAFIPPSGKGRVSQARMDSLFPFL